MLGSLIAALRSNDALDKAFMEFNQMLESGHWMYNEVQSILDGSKNPMDSREPIFTKDQERKTYSVTDAFIHHMA